MGWILPPLLLSVLQFLWWIYGGLLDWKHWSLYLPDWEHLSLLLDCKHWSLYCRIENIYLYFWIENIDLSTAGLRTFISTSGLKTLISLLPDWEHLSLLLDWKHWSLYCRIENIYLYFWIENIDLSTAGLKTLISLLLYLIRGLFCRVSPTSRMTNGRRCLTFSSSLRHSCRPLANFLPHIDVWLSSLLCPVQHLLDAYRHRPPVVRHTPRRHARSCFLTESAAWPPWQGRMMLLDDPHSSHPALHKPTCRIPPADLWVPPHPTWMLVTITEFWIRGQLRFSHMRRCFRSYFHRRLRFWTSRHQT